MSDDSDLRTPIATVITPLLERIEQLYNEQQELARLLAQTTVRLDKLAEQITGLQAEAFWQTRRAEGAERTAQ